MSVLWACSKRASLSARYHHRSCVHLLNPALMISILLESPARLSMLALAAVVLLHRLCVLHLVVLMLDSRLHSSSVLLCALAETIARTFRLSFTSMVFGDRLPGLGFFFNIGFRSFFLTTYTLEGPLGRSVCQYMQWKSLVTDLQVIKQRISLCCRFRGLRKKQPPHVHRSCNIPTPSTPWSNIC